LPGPANALADNNNELPSNRVKSFVAFMNDSLYFLQTRCTEHGAPARGGFDLVNRFIRWCFEDAVRPKEAAKFALNAENNFMIESG